jgi:hypothetical protein
MGEGNSNVDAPVEKSQAFGSDSQPEAEQRADTEYGIVSNSRVSFASVDVTGIISSNEVERKTSFEDDQ